MCNYSQENYFLESSDLIQCKPLIDFDTEYYKANKTVEKNCMLEAISETILIEKPPLNVVVAQINTLTTVSDFQVCFFEANSIENCYSKACKITKVQNFSLSRIKVNHPFVHPNLLTVKMHNNEQSHHYHILP